MGYLSVPAAPAVYLDANCFIYYVERIEPYYSALRPLYEAAASGSMILVSSELTLLECLVKPRQMRDADLERMFRSILQDSREVRLAPISMPVLERAIALRVERGLRTPDAIHAATSLHSGCRDFYTNDAAFARVPELGVHLLSKST